MIDPRVIELLAAAWIFTAAELAVVELVGLGLAGLRYLNERGYPNVSTIVSLERRRALRVLDETMDATAAIQWAEQAEEQILASLDHLRAGLAILVQLNGRLEHRRPAALIAFAPAGAKAALAGAEPTSAAAERSHHGQSTR